jgi:acyl-CoA synthetase (AMP-forming)/AMP-acid ligase II
MAEWCKDPRDLGLNMNGLPAETLAKALEAAQSRWPERPALVFGESTLTYAELWQSVLSLGNTYRHLGISPGDRIVCSLSNRPELFIALGAAWICGAIHVGVDYQSTASELSSVIELALAKAVLYEPTETVPDPFLVLRKISKAYPNVKLIVAGDQPLPSEYLSFSELISRSNNVANVSSSGSVKPLGDDPAMIFISSGTTGQPKAAIGFHANLSQRWQRLAGWLGFGPDDVHLAQMPLSHGFGIMMAVAALLTGGKLVLLRDFSAEEALQRIAREHVTVLNGAPTHFRLILDRLDSKNHDVSSLRFSVGTAAPFSPSLINAIWKKLRVDFMFMYGSSEGVGVATTDREDMLRGAVGRPAPGSVQIVGPDLKPLAMGQVGEIAFSRNVYPIQYWNNTGSDQKVKNISLTNAMENSWYYSGDLGCLDEEGRLYVYGRLKYQINRGGLKVDPVEVENALMRVTDVKEAAVIGVPDPVLDEIVCACIVSSAETSPSLRQVRDLLRADLAPYKLPDELCLLERIPRTSIGKVDLEKLREVVAAAPRQKLPLQRNHVETR